MTEESLDESASSDESLSPNDLPEVTYSMELVQRYQEGEATALNELLVRYQDRILRIVRLRLGAKLRVHLQSDDLLNLTNMVVWRKLGELEVRDQGSILRWLSQVVLNQIRDARDYFHADRRDVDRVLDVQGSADSDSRGGIFALLADGSERPDEAAEAKEWRDILDASMVELSEVHEGYYNVILVRDYESADWATVAFELGYVDKQRPDLDPRERLDRAVHAVQEFHSRAWIRLRQIARRRLGGDRQRPRD
jgi:hypothetical protein